jgi:mRNA interferase MazF
MLPDVGDIVWVELDPVLGSEQAGRRPALVLSHRNYHQESPRAVICPITSRENPWPFSVSLPPGLRTRGTVLVDQIRTVDRSKRMFATIEHAPRSLVDEVLGRLAALLGIEGISVVPEPQDAP